MTFEYAEWIATNWNANEAIANFGGVVTKFRVQLEYIKKYDVQIAGGVTSQELWVPAEELDEFNKHIIGQIRMISAYYSNEFIGTKVQVDETISREPSELYINPSQFVKGETQYQEWLKRNDNS